MLITSAAKQGWQYLDKVTAGGAATTLTTNTLPAKEHLRFFFFWPSNTGASGHSIKFNGDGSGIYSFRLSANGGADSTGTEQNGAQIFPSTDGVGFAVLELVNVAASRKVGFFSCGVGVAQTTAPSRQEGYVVWSNTSDQVTALTLTSNSGNLPSGAYITVYGRNDDE